MTLLGGPLGGRGGSSSGNGGRAEDTVPFVTERDFESVVLTSEVPVLIVFTMERSQPCRAIAPDLAPLAKEAAELSNRTWGLLTRAGNDKSHLARQIERSADVYTSRVSNFLHATPFVYLRSPRGSLPHDP